MNHSLHSGTWRACANAWCKESFEVTDGDLSFYDKVSPVFGGKKYPIPPPTLCPDCRQQRRLSWRNERQFYHDSCAFCKKSVVSMYAPGSPHTVYCYDCWWGDQWDALHYGRDIDFTRPFFEQLEELRRVVPRLYLFNLHSENSIYTTHSANNKNCYMGVSVGKCEDCYYGHWVLDSNNVVDALYSEKCERCYEISYCSECYETLHSQHCHALRDSLYCYECRNCDHCIGCTQLRGKSFYILNTPASEEEFRRVARELLASREARHQMQEAFQNLKLQCIHRYALQMNCVDSTGDDLYNCKNLIHGFNCRDTEDCAYMYDLGKNKNCMDCYEHGWCVSSELNYELHGGMAGYHLLFCHICAEGRDLLYSDCCFNQCANLFGCISLKQKKYCILNKQYTKEDYEALVPTLIEHMQKTGEWGEFVDARHSPFSYNESVAQEYFPIKKEEAIARGLRWRDSDPKEYLPQTYGIPAGISEVSDDVIEQVLACEECRKNYKIIPQELALYRSMGIPLPSACHDCRHRRRVQIRNPRKLWNRVCAQCQKSIVTSFSPERPAVRGSEEPSGSRRESVYCEECYLAAVY